MTSLIFIAHVPQEPKITLDLTIEGIKQMQKDASEEKQKSWSVTGIHINGCWMDQKQSKYMLPDKMVYPMALTMHGPADVGRDGVVNCMTKFWVNKNIRKYADEVCRNCMTCAQHNVGKTALYPKDTLCSQL